MRTLQKELVNWSKETYKDIFQKVATMENNVKMKEMQLEINNTKTNKLELRNAENELMHQYKIEEEY